MPTSPATARLLLISGAPASGKTRLATALAERHGWLCLGKDEIKETLFDVLGADDAAWSRRLSDASFALLFQLAPRLLGGRVLVLEGNFRPGEHEPVLRSLLERSGAELAQVLCRADASVRARRLRARALDPGRHRAHRDEHRPVAVEEGAAFLELPGARFEFDGSADWQTQFTLVAAALQSWT
jgi:predicted kinase